ncbi:MAG: hypothetical protein OXI39_12570 [Gemmatimonadota bacterium]|uniref:hypothetical protein n=1 Tax=Candidatus Palauibacter scopulicola TaxID=3056741 RepID=UPI00239E81F0|nr:hypothetical protein [Candidatus Palauibacter scopulicola]MDE2663822.1 hypothetical protein [Candidatus Palauibacter scopulicola]
MDPEQLDEVREALLQIARTNGLGAHAEGPSFSRFDAATGAAMGEMPLLESGEALRDDVWTFIGVTLLPDVVHWRFGEARERYLGGVRNTFQRLWLRAKALDRGAEHPQRWGLLEELTEDALVQITERPSIGGDPTLARAVAEAWLRARNHHGRRAMESIMRRAILRVRIWNEIRSLADLPSDLLAPTLDEAFGLPARDEQNRKSRAGLHRGQTEGASLPSDPETDEPDRRPTNQATGEPVESSNAIRRAASRIADVAKRRRLISPKSTAALTVLMEGQRELTRSERNAVLHLLWRMSAAALLPEEVAVVLPKVSA